MFDYIFTIGCFDKFHKGHLKLLNSMKNKCKNLVIGIHDSESIQELKGIFDINMIDPIDVRMKNIKNHCSDIFIINNTDPTTSIKQYISEYFTNYDPILIGSSSENNKVIKNVHYNSELYFVHSYHDKFSNSIKGDDLIITRVDKNSGWGQNLIGYKKNWCFMRADDNENFPGIDYIKSIMPIKYLPYSYDISSTKLRDYKNNKVGLMNYLLKKVVTILNEHKIPYYLDCGTLLGCVRDNCLMEKDTDVDVTIHLSFWDKLKKIDFNKYNLIKTRTLQGFPDRDDSNMISVKTKFGGMYCDIYCNPAFPYLENRILNGIVYSIPKNSELYLQQLYGNWKIPSDTHASTRYHRGKGLINSRYSDYWDKSYKIYNCKL